ncbi:hypothetical protein EDB83DRAFT_2372290 [Lactarius deliciosus]|nr:hypothetical protein EDB83DRAFT_2372290 [Lactarius deliciosus]
MPMTSSSSSLSSSVVREGCTPSNPRTGELGSSPSLSGLRLPPPPSTDGSIVPLPAYSPAPVSVLAPAPPKTFPARQSIDPSPPRFGEARLKLRPWVGLVRARPTSTPAPGLWSTPQAWARLDGRGYPRCAAVAAEGAEARHRLRPHARPRGRPRGP